MIDISIEYQPFSFFSYKRKLTGSFPSSLDELSPLQLIAFTRLTKNTITENSFLKTITGFKKYTIKKLDQYHRYTLMNLLTFFTDIKSHHCFIIPVIKTSSGKLYAPKPKLSGIIMGQFIFADSYFTSYQAGNKPEDLCKFVASLYLPKNTPFSETLIEPSSRALAHVKSEILEAVVLNYILVQQWLCLAYPLIFHANNDTENTSIKTQKPTVDNSGWLKIFDNIVGDDIVNYDKYTTMPVHNIFRWMTHKIKENLKRK